MCLGIPGRVESIDGVMATVDFWGVKRQVNLTVVDEPVEPGDFVLNHVGYAIRKIPASEVAETLALYEELLRSVEDSDATGDPMAGDVAGELRATTRGSDGDGSG